ncbi:MAG: undecaprenyl-phosphate glucose phosphotransferase [Chryseosolibacter sp.]
MIYKYSTLIKVINILADFLILNFAFLVALFIYEPENFHRALDSDHRLNFLLLNLVWFYCANLKELYNNILTRKADVTVRAVITALIIFGLITIGLMLSFPQLTFSYKLLAHFHTAFALLILFWKTSFLLLRKSRRRFWIEYKRIVLIGAGPVGMNLYKYINANHLLGYRIEGVFDDHYAPSGEDDPVLLGSVDECLNYISEHGISEVYCALPSYESARIKGLMQEADKQMVRMRLVPDISNIFDKNVMLEVYDCMPVMTARQEPLENIVNGIIKRGFDIVFSLLAIAFVLSWLTPIIALLIRLDSKGPVFFRQLRSGRDNKPFYCIKFRSMMVNADADQMQARKGDARVTRLGSFLRKSSIDELPQFFNVLMGDMSVVGPRPHMLKHTKDYSLLIDKYMVRHFLTPGITGWAQVNGLRGEIKEPASLHKRIDADIWYLENWSLFLDLKIVFLTIWQSMRGNQNAY